jgi:two-component system, OmpR family, phosphate regulon sensor histidine kinase PhoR
VKNKAAFLIARSIVLVLTLCVAGFGLMYAVVALSRGLFSWHELWWNVLVDALALVLLAGVAFASSKIFGAKRENLFVTLANAMKRIAEGDFNVTVRMEDHDRNDFMGQVVSGLNEMAESLKKMEAMRQEFVSDVSHEIQSPLTSIGGFAKALRDEGLGTKQRAHYLDIIESESQRLSRLSDSLLKLSALDARTQTISTRPYTLDAQIRNVVLACESQWKAKGVEVIAELEPLSVTADEAMLAQVWGNLIHNAVKFTPSGGTICVSLRREEGFAVVRVRDSGMGISPEDIPLVFDRFFKADKSRSNANGVGGSGLGLSIAQKIVTLHRGTITAESAGAGAGSLFAVRIPLEPGVAVR